MRISKTALWLSVIDAFLVLLASASGIFLKSIYARETPSWAIQGIGQDIVNLVAALALFIAAYFVNKGSFKAVLVWGGILLYLMYTYVIYAFDVHFNSLFLVYVAILGLSFYALVGSVIHIRLDSLHPYFSANTNARLVSVFLLLLGIVFYLLWLSEDIPALLAGKIPQSLTAVGLLTNPVHILDLGLYLPAIIITAMLLWRRKLLGYLLAGPFLVFSILTGTAILVVFLVMSSKGMPRSIGIEIFITVLVLVGLFLSALFLREVNLKKHGSAQMYYAIQLILAVHAWYSIIDASNLSSSFSLGDSGVHDARLTRSTGHTDTFWRRESDNTHAPTESPV